MKALRSLRTLTSKSHLSSPYLSRLYSAQPQQENNSDSVFDSGQFELPNLDSDDSSISVQPTWDNKYREKANKKIFGGEETLGQKSLRVSEKEDDKRRRAAILAKALLEAALDNDEEEDEEEDRVVDEEDQRSLSVGIVGAPNAGKSALTNYMVCFSFHFFASRVSLFIASHC